MDARIVSIEKYQKTKMAKSKIDTKKIKKSRKISKTQKIANQKTSKLFFLKSESKLCCTLRTVNVMETEKD